MDTYRAFIPEEDLRSYHTATYRIESLTSLYESPFVHGFIGEADGAATGFARMQFHKMENRVYLASLYILPGFQHRWYGKRGFRFVREEPFRMGGTTVPHRIGYKVIGE